MPLNNHNEQAHDPDPISTTKLRDYWGQRRFGRYQIGAQGCLEAGGPQGSGRYVRNQQYNRLLSS